MAHATMYQNLLPKERQEFIGKIVHAIQSSNVCFYKAAELIDLGEYLKVFDGVTILPTENPLENESVQKGSSL